MRKIIFDCDNTMGLPRKEIDDGLTLLYLLGRPDIELVGITTAFGNGTIDEVYQQTQRLLRDLGRTDIPLLKGAGARGQPPTEAARFLAETAADHPGEISVLATGPLANLGAAAEVDGGFFASLKQIACMGGYLHALRIGWRDVAELNLSGDPERSWATLGAGCPLTLMNAHICLDATFGWPHLWRVRHWGRSMRHVISYWLLAFGIHCGIARFYLWDLVPAVYLSHPELFDKNPVRIRSTVKDLESGTLVLSAADQDALINMPTRIVDRARFRTVLFEAWSSVQLLSNTFARLERD